MHAKLRKPTCVQPPINEGTDRELLEKGLQQGRGRQAPAEARPSLRLMLVAWSRGRAQAQRYRRSHGACSSRNIPAHTSSWPRCPACSTRRLTAPAPVRGGGAGGIKVKHRLRLMAATNGSATPSQTSTPPALFTVHRAPVQGGQEQERTTKNRSAAAGLLATAGRAVFHSAPSPVSA